VKNFENRSILGKDRQKFVAYFLGHPVYVAENYRVLGLSVLKTPPS